MLILYTRNIVVLFISMSIVCGRRRNHLTVPPRVIHFEENTEFEMLIAGGYRPVKHKLVKYLVSIRTAEPWAYFGDNHYCAGTIITSTAVLTAAHCIMDPDKIITRARRIVVVAGAPNRLKKLESTLIYKVVDIIPHPRYEFKSRHDLAILRLNATLPLRPASVLAIPMSSSPPEIGATCTVVGWGRLYQRGPYAAEAVYLNVTILDDMFCIQTYKKFRKGMICGTHRFEKRGGCMGDSGGPLICADILYGILSFEKCCNDGNFPSIFADIASHRRWIDHVTATKSCANLISLSFLQIYLAICVQAL